MGIIPSPRDCHQVIRGLKTLPLRMRKHVENSLIIGKFLESHNQVEKVLHPGNSEIIFLTKEKDSWAFKKRGFLN